MKDSSLFAPMIQLKTRLLIIMIAGIILILMMVLIVSNQLKKNVAREERIKNEIILASRIQQQFLPQQEEVRGAGFSLSGLTRPAKVVGGDFYGYKIRAGSVFFYVGDVSGKGVPASLFMMAAQMLIEDALDEDPDPATLLKHVNTRLTNISTTGMFATMIACRLDLKTRELTFACAGHPPLLIGNGQALYSPLIDFVPPVSVFAEQDYRNYHLTLNQGDVVVAFSDGITEAENSRKEQFGAYRLATTVEANGQAGSTEIKNRIVEAVGKFTGNNEQNDDLTLVVLKL